MILVNSGRQAVRPFQPGRGDGSWLRRNIEAINMLDRGGKTWQKPKRRLTDAKNKLSLCAIVGPAACHCLAAGPEIAPA